MLRYERTLQQAKMHAGIPLAYADRQAWRERVAASIDAQRRAKKQPGIIVCSALKRSYRQIIVGNRLVYWRGGRDLIAVHLAGRNHHFMPASLMKSQIDTLEEPDPREDPLTADVGPPADQIAQKIIRLPATMRVRRPRGRYDSNRLDSVWLG